MKKITHKRLSKMMKIVFALSVFLTGSIGANAQTYCNPSYPSGSSSWRITQVSINEFSHSPAQATHDYTSESINFQPGDELEVSVTTIGWISVGLAVDWNKDGDFDDADEVMTIAEYIGADPAVYNFTVTIPLTVTPDSYRLRLWNIGANAGGGNPEGSPCGIYGYGSWVDYTLSYIEDCNEVPNAGVVADMEVCSNINFTLSSANHSVPAGGQTVQWQSSIDGLAWADMTGATTFDYTINGGISEEMYYRLIVTCTINEESDTSEVIHVTILSANECYCIPEGTVAGRHINNFSTTNAIQNISNFGTGFSTGGYGDYTAMVLEQLISESVSFEVNIIGGTAGFRIWVDWNQDGQFDASEVAYSSSNYASNHSGSFNVPLSAMAGTTRMRIVSHWSSTSGDVNPCATAFSYGEFEDYTFEVTPLDECTEANAGTVSSSFETCSNIGFTLSTSGASEPADGQVIQWQSSIDGLAWIDIAGATTLNYTVNGGVNEEMYYRLIVACTISDESDTSEVIHVTLLPEMECYCEVTSTSTSYGIGNFTTTNGIENISNSSGGGGYSDYTDQVVSQLMGQSVDFSIASANNSAGMGIWIDWNDNGSFDDPGDKVYGSGSYVTNATGTITVPLTAAPGPHRMRVVANYLAPNPTPCGNLGNQGYGEAEDYTFVVVAPEGCLMPISISKSNIENNSITISWSSIGLGDQWESYNYELRTEGEPGSGAVGLVYSGELLEAHTIDFNNLESGVEYTFFAQTNCEGGSESDWTNGYTFALPTYIPIVVTGFDSDVVANGIGTAQSSTTNDVDGVNFALVAEDYQLNENAPFPTRFLPNDRQITKDEKWFVLTDYAENNSLRLTGGQEGTLEFVEPRAAEEVYVLGVSGSGTSLVSGTINFGDGSTQAFSELSYPDWFQSSASVVASGIGRVNLTNNGTEAGNGPNLYESVVTIDEENIEKVINSVTFSNSNSASGIMNIMAISIFSSQPVCIINPFELGEDLEICEGDELILSAGATNDNENLSFEWQDGSTDLVYAVTESGTYIVTVTYEDICTLSDTIQVTVNPLPVVVEISSTTVDGFFFSFTAEDVENAETYNWDFGDGITTQQVEASHYYAEEGEYTVTLTVTNDCGTVTVSTTIVVGDLGISKNEISQMVKLYPNPTADEVTVEISNHAIMEEISVINNLGQVVYQFNPNASVVQIDVSAMTVGIYTVVIKTETAVTSKKLNVLH